MTPEEFQRYLEKRYACPEAREWAQGKTPQQAWEECERADWLLWWAARSEHNSPQSLVLAACDCARLVLPFIPQGEDRPRLAIEAAEAWASNPTAEKEKEVRAAAAAAQDAEAALGMWAARAAARAAAAAKATVWAAAAAAGAAAQAAAEATWARNKALRQMAVLVRQRLVCPVVLDSSRNQRQEKMR